MGGLVKGRVGRGQQKGDSEGIVVGFTFFNRGKSGFGCNARPIGGRYGGIGRCRSCSGRFRRERCGRGGGGSLGDILRFDGARGRAGKQQGQQSGQRAMFHD